MRVFISWSGKRSRALAEALREHLPLILHYVEPWVSDSDIHAGARWADSVATELSTSDFGILCVTRENLTAPWLLFEAGALGKAFETARVVPLLLSLDFADVSGPITMFQAKKASRDGVRSLVASMQDASGAISATERVEQMFDLVWPKLAGAIDAIPPEVPVEIEDQPRSEADVLEELVVSVRSLDGRFAEFDHQFKKIIDVVDALSEQRELALGLNAIGRRLASVDERLDRASQEVSEKSTPPTEASGPPKSVLSAMTEALRQRHPTFAWDVDEGKMEVVVDLPEPLSKQDRVALSAVASRYAPWRIRIKDAEAYATGGRTRRRGVGE